MEAGLSIARYKRKLERGEIKFTTDGKVVAISRMDIKRARKAAEKAERNPQPSKEANVNVVERSEGAFTVVKKRTQGEGVERLSDQSSTSQKKCERDQEDVKGAEQLEKKKRKKGKE
jgi:hypothetical protein